MSISNIEKEGNLLLKSDECPFCKSKIAEKTSSKSFSYIKEQISEDVVQIEKTETILMDYHCGLQIRLDKERGNFTGINVQSNCSNQNHILRQILKLTDDE